MQLEFGFPILHMTLATIMKYYESLGHILKEIMKLEEDWFIKRFIQVIKKYNKRPQNLVHWC